MMFEVHVTSHKYTALDLIVNLGLGSKDGTSVIVTCAYNLFYTTISRNIQHFKPMAYCHSYLGHFVKCLSSASSSVYCITELRHPGYVEGPYLLTGLVVTLHSWRHSVAVCNCNVVQYANCLV